MLNNMFAFPQILFQAIRGISYRGDIALDDIRVSSGACSNAGRLIFIHRLKSVFLYIISHFFSNEDSGVLSCYKTAISVFGQSVKANNAS